MNKQIRFLLGLLLVSTLDFCATPTGCPTGYIKQNDGLCYLPGSPYGHAPSPCPSGTYRAVDGACQPIPFNPNQA